MVSANTSVRFAGHPFDFGDVRLIVPSLSTRQVRENFQDIIDLATDNDGQATTTDYVTKRLAVKMKVIHLAVSRNYPDITLDELEDMVELHDIEEILVAALGRRMSPRTKVVPSGELEPVATSI